MRPFSFYYFKAIRKYRSLYPKKYLSQYLKDLTLKEINLTNKDDDIFFGYHDRTPFHPKEDIVLAHRRIKNSKFLDVGYFNLNEPNKFNKVSETYAFSRQQGSMLKWDNHINNLDINFNTLEKGKAKNISMNLLSKSITEELEMPIYCFNNKNSLGISCNFFHLAKMRPGYGIEHSDIESAIPLNKDGIWLFDRDNNVKKLLVSYQDIFKSIPKIYHQNFHLNHLSFSPNSKYIVWFFVCEKNNTRKIFFQGKNILTNGEIFNIEDQNLSSHFCWVDDASILNINRDKDLNWKYSIHSLDNLNKKELSYRFGFDGHPMFNGNYGHTIIDSTPDQNRMQHLQILTKNFNKSYEIGKWHTPENFSGPDRVDLHPRWNKDGNRISIDLPINGIRSQKIIYLNEEVLKNI